MPEFGTYGQFLYGSRTYRLIGAILKFLHIPDLLGFRDKSDSMAFTETRDTVGFEVRKDDMEFTAVPDTTKFIEVE